MKSMNNIPHTIIFYRYSSKTNKRESSDNILLVLIVKFDFHSILITKKCDRLMQDKMIPAKRARQNKKLGKTALFYSQNTDICLPRDNHSDNESLLCFVTKAYYISQKSF